MASGVVPLMTEPHTYNTRSKLSLPIDMYEERTDVDTTLVLSSTDGSPNAFNSDGHIAR